MKRTLMDSEFEVCFDLRLWTSGFSNLTAHYFSNHSFSARLNVIFLHYQTPSPECLFSELFAKWPLPSFLPSFCGKITMFTSPPVFHIISPSLAILFKCAVVGWHCCYSGQKNQTTLFHTKYWSKPTEMAAVRTQRVLCSKALHSLKSLDLCEHVDCNDCCVPSNSHM